MSQEQISQPVICIDRKKNRIRIHKQTLHMLGDPEYIQLLVNPNCGMFALRGSFKGDHLAHRVRKYQISPDNCYEIYSKNLMNALVKVNSDLQEDQSYRLYGEMVVNVGVCRFDLHKLNNIGEESK